MVEYVKRIVRVKTHQEIIPDEPYVQGFPVHKWSIEVCLLDSDGNEIPANIFDKVVYHLHPTFASPNRTFKKPPFKIEEQGWGGFEMSISGFLLEKGGERKMKHDLHFAENNYSVEHTIQVPINKPKLAQALLESGPVPGYTSDGQHITGISNTEATTSIPNAATNNTTASADADPDTANVNTTSATTTAAVAPGTPKTSLDATITNPTSNGTDAKRKSGSPDGKVTKKSKLSHNMKGSVDLDKLALGLTKLNEDDLVGVVQMITDNRTSEMNIKNNVEEGEFIMDLFSLPETLLKSLWEYVRKNLEQ
ncbi:related to Transcription initiation factor TFIID subunit 14 [Saccharomycodes ludwigii]|uniref:Related to Transcription initiation factor TFIID subunit 14 n=1 Tax=Saccharomycodes ludwigii TaxID=36035 RepID=A0A376B5W2_9ASCO|nr:hypothetical protein SCDLUD_002101 [Saccharomycodes ludwigii]KAH3902283.1 hypothetical protein SCDLUD_002101 [Saccharomycodes ludwigii]SSD60078.1 related to Transcription initiation factor TFIID subunit 14 [Saccharomycodes ludwigii]